MHCARARARMKWHNSVNFTGASEICSGLGFDFLPSYYLGKLPLTSVGLRTTVFSIYRHCRIKIEEHNLSFKQWHKHYMKLFQNFFYWAGTFHILVFLKENMKNCRFHREAITFELNVLFAWLCLLFFCSLYFTTLCPNLFSIKCLWKTNVVCIKSLRLKHVLLVWKRKDVTIIW